MRLTVAPNTLYIEPSCLLLNLSI